jgi:hypothetical protein
LINLLTLDARSLKIILTLSAEPDGLPISHLAQAIGNVDAKTTRAACLRIQADTGILTNQARWGLSIWRLAGCLRLLNGNLYWQPEPQPKTEEHPIPTANQRSIPPSNGNLAHPSPIPPNKMAIITDDEAISPTIPNPSTTEQGISAVISSPTPESFIKNLQGVHSPSPVFKDLKELKTNKDSVLPKNLTSLKNSNLSPPNDRPALDRSSYLPLPEASGSTQTASQPEKDSATNQQAALNTLLLRKLFGRSITWRASFSSYPTEQMLGWLAQVYTAHKKGILTKPWGLVYRALNGQLKSTLPDKAYRTTPTAHLPSAYLRAVGLPTLGEQSLARFLPAQAANPSDPPPEPQPAPPPSDDQTGWEYALRSLREAMNPASFHNHLGQHRLAGWDETKQNLRVALPDPETLEWCQERLTTTIERLLVGVYNRPVGVRFVLG